MKTPLRYQLTQFDCGPTSMLNALSFLLEREEIPSEVLKYVYAIMVDRNHGTQRPGGTSEAAMRFFAEWLNDCHERIGFPIEARHLHGNQVSITEGSEIVQWVEQKGIAILSCFLCGSDHYVLLDGFERDESGQIRYARLFDPFYLDEGEAFAPGGRFYGLKDELTFVSGEPFSCNRRVSVHLMEACEKCHYSLMCNTPREATLLRRCDSDGEKRIENGRPV